MRYLPHTDRDRQEMLAAIGVNSIEDLFADIPEAVRFRGAMNLPAPLSEPELVAHMRELSARNADVEGYVCFLGAGAYDHFVPSVVGHILGRSEFYTAYTPYQPEVSQGVLQTIYEYQSLMCALTGMDVCQASMYDGATSLTEAALIAVGATRRYQVIVSRAVHPEYREVLRTYGRAQEIEVVELPCPAGMTEVAAARSAISDRTACVIVQHPNFFGCLEEMDELAEAAKAKNALFVACVDPISLGVLKPPGEYGADLVVGEGQPLGISLSFGGPYLGFFLARQELVRRMPGRIAGRTRDTQGRRGFVLTLQTREQHIRREKATSNICSNEALCALAATVYLCTLGKKGIEDVAKLCLQKAHYAQSKLAAAGFPLSFDRPFFKEFTVRSPVDGGRVQGELLRAKILGGIDLGRWYPEFAGNLLFCVTERRTRAEIDALAARLEGLR